MKGKRQKRERGEIKHYVLIGIALLIVMAVSETSAQPVCRKTSVESAIASHGANEVVEFYKIRSVEVFYGRVRDVNGMNVEVAVVDIFPAPELTKQAAALELCRRGKAHQVVSR